MDTKETVVEKPKSLRGYKIISKDLMDHCLIHLLKETQLQGVLINSHNDNGIIFQGKKRKKKKKSHFSGGTTFIRIQPELC